MKPGAARPVELSRCCGVQGPRRWALRPISVPNGAPGRCRCGRSRIPGNSRRRRHRGRSPHRARGRCRNRPDGCRWPCRLGLGRTVARDDFEGLPAAAHAERVEDVVQSGIHVRDFAGAEVAEQPVHALDRRLDVAAAIAEGGAETFVGVCVAKREMKHVARLSGGDGGGNVRT